MSGAAMSMEARPRAVAWAPVLAVYAAALLQGMTLVSFPAVSAVLKSVLSLTDADYGAIFLPQVALAIIGGIIGGALAGRIGLKALLITALAANGASQALLAAAGFVPTDLGFPLLLGGTAALGLGFGLIGAPINALPRLLFPLRAETAIVAAHTLIGLGLALGPLLAAPFIAANAWYGFSIALIALTVVVAAAGGFVPLPADAAAAARDGTSRAGPSPVSAAGFWLFAGITILYAFAEGTFANWAVIYLKDGRGLDETIASYALSAFWGALVAGRLIISVLVLKVPAKLIWLTLPALMIAAFWLLPLADSAITGIGFFALAGIACSAFLPLTISLAAERFPDSVAFVSSMLIAALMAGVGIGSFLIGALQAQVPLATLYQVSSAYPLLVLLLAWPALRTRPPQ